jgi:PPOX class probable F420-dependent enzyme
VIPDHLADFWTHPRLATLGTLRRDGSPHLVPVKCMRVGDEFHVLTRPETVKVRNLAGAPRASLAEHTDTLWVTVEGAAHVSHDPELADAARAAYLARFGRPDTWGTCVLVLRPERVLYGD